MMGDADHFSRSTEREILSDHEDGGIKGLENEKEVITSPSPGPMALEAKKITRAKSSRKNSRRGALVLAEDYPGRVNAAEHEEKFCSCVNLYVDYLLMGAVKELVVDAPLREKTAKEMKIESIEEKKDTHVESGPVFTATDDSYMDLISEEIHSTLPCEERKVDEDQPSKTVDSDKQQLKDKYMNLNVCGHESPPFLSSTEEEGNDAFEMKAEEYMNTSFPENDENEFDSTDDVFEDVPSSIQQEDSETTEMKRRHRQHNQSRRKYEFEVDCETGMVFSFEVVESGEDGSGDDYEYEDCDDCDGYDERNSAELDPVDGDSNICIVEFQPDDDDVFQVINDDEDIEETVYMVVEDDGTDGKLAKKTSNFRARSPRKLPRAIREGTERHRRRCYSTGDAERFECLESSSSEFYSHADTIDRFLTLPSPPKSSPDEVDDSEDDFSSSQEELTEILDPPGLKNHPGTSARLDTLTDVTEDTTDVFDDDLILTTESKCFVHNETESQESLPDGGRNSNPRDEERCWQVRRVQHQMKLNQLEASSPQHVNVSYNTNHRPSEGVSDVDMRPERCQDLPKYTASSSSGMVSFAFQDIPPLNENEYEEVTRTDPIENTSAEEQRPVDTGYFEEVNGLVEGRHDTDENVFEYIRGHGGRLSRREVNKLLTDLAREKEAMDRMLRDAHRAQDEYIQLRKGVKKLLERLESCQPA